MNTPGILNPKNVPASRRDFLYGLGASLGSMALTHQWTADASNAFPSSMLPKEPMLPGKAKACILLFMEGGPGHMDTFDPKPELQARHTTQSHRTAGLANGYRFFVGSPFASRKVGQSGLDMSAPWVHLAHPDVADEWCNYRGCQAESLNHPEALFHMNTGSRLGTDPALGSWVTYGLGSINQNLPGYVVMTELAAPQGGAGNWSQGFLPATYRGTLLRPTGSPILNLQPPAHKTPEHVRSNLDTLQWLNQQHAREHPDHKLLESRMQDYELAFRMQMEVPEVMTLDGETSATKAMYGLDKPHTATFGRQCLMARRLVENGVRFIQIFSGGWDSHDYLEQGHQSRIASVDQPMAALIRDLKQRGMLDETLVVWTGEFGRTPDNNRRGGVTSLGRGHNIDAMTMMLAGGGFRKGSIVGATDEIGAEATECIHPIRDFHVTLLHLMGLQDHRLTYFHGGRYKQLSQFGGRLIPELLA